MSYINLKIPEHSYFFGFLQTDGTLVKARGFRNKGRLQIEVEERDSHILDSFRRLFPLVYTGVRTRSRDTNFRKNYKSYNLTICDMDFRNEVNRLGLPYGKKSSIIVPPKTNFCERDYIRGLVDGDGSVGITDKGFPFISFTVKSEEIKKYLLNVIEKVAGEKKKLSKNKRDGIYNVMISRERAQKFIKYLYYPNCLTLKRKFKKAQKALKWKRPQNLKRIFKKFWEPWEDKYILNYFVEESCKRLKRTKGSIKMRLWRLNNHKAPYLKACLNDN